MNQSIYLFLIFLVSSCNTKQEIVYPVTYENYFENERLILEAKLLSRAESKNFFHLNDSVISDGAIHIMLKLKPKKDLLNQINSEKLVTSIYEENLSKLISFDLEDFIKMKSGQLEFIPSLYLMENTTYSENSYLILLRFDLDKNSSEENFELEIEPTKLNSTLIKFPIQLLNS
ncbi:MAG: hypothetical protein HOP11_07925 [Saprospiraceae bacterium]|nr:hypothetical protein [Saprospiraceae bacterium]